MLLQLVTLFTFKVVNLQYDAFTITDKRLTVIGPGWAPAGNFSAFPAAVYGITISGANSSNTEIQGLELVNSVTIGSSSKPDNLRFIRDHFRTSVVYINYGTLTLSGYLFQGNWFDGGGVNAHRAITTLTFCSRIMYFIRSLTVGNVSGFTTVLTCFLIITYGMVLHRAPVIVWK